MGVGRRTGEGKRCKDFLGVVLDRGDTIADGELWRYSRCNHGEGKESVKLCGDLPYKAKSKHLNLARERNPN